ncbi:LysM peptidoglycan-binding domain-containing protein [Acidovorax sp. NCPPB 2350]|nr:LysM peptidoglycan-binding domain-containing protein [Acidovorax sp. NCPPB 2350]
MSNVVQERHADGGRVDYAFNAFGDKVSAAELVDAGTGRTVVTNYAYDRLSRLTQTTLAQGDALRYRVSGMDGKPVQLTSDVHGSSGVSMGQPEAMSVLERNEYDEAGRKVRVVNGNEEATRYRYDRAGNVVMSGQETVYATAAADAARQADANAVASPLAYVVRYRYDALGRKIGQSDAAGMNQAWTYDAFGHLIGRTESKTGGGTVDYTYVYNRAGDLTHEGNASGKNIDYRYDGAGQRTEIRDNYLGQTTRYGYDLAGNRTSERVEQKTLLSSGVLENVVYQDNHLVYDAQRRLRAVFDGRADVRITYDLAGNRSQVTTHVINTVRKDPNADIASVGRQEQEVIHTSTTAYGYDAMNRQTSSLEQPGGPQVRSIQHIYTFDLAGNRTEDKIATVNITATQGDQTVNTRFEYHYDALHRLTSYRGYGVAEDQVNQYDGAGRVVYSNSLVMRGSGNKTPQYENRYNRYDAMGKLQDTRVVVRGTAGDVVSRVDVAYHDAGGATGLGYDAAGNLKGNRQVTDGDEGKATTTRYEYQFLAGSYQQTASTAQREGTTATTKTWRDANGFVSNIEQVTGVGDERFNRAFVNDAQGNAIYVNQGAGHVGRIQNPGTYLGGWVGDSLNPGHVQRQLVANGEVLARYGDAPDSENPPANAGEAQKYVDTAEFRLNAAPLQLKGANLDAIAYTVVGGETLKDIARNVLGDATLWWRIAEANGLAVSGDGQLAAGQTLRVPKLALNANSVETFQPYDPSRVTGSLDAVLPAPAGQGGGCGAVGKIIMVVIAVAVAYVTAGAAAGALGSTFGAATGVTIGTTTLSATGAFIASAIGGAVGSIVSQAAGNLMGIQDGFSWKGVALSALGGGISSGLAGTELLGGPGFGVTVARAAVGNALSQGIGVVTGLQQRFDWKGVVASAVGAGVGQMVGEALNGYTLREGLAGPVVPPVFAGLGDFGGGLARGAVAGLAAGTVAALARGGRISIQQVANDAFGNALGSSFADQMKSLGQQAAPALQGIGPWSETNYRNGMDVDSDRVTDLNGFMDAFSKQDSGNGYSGVQLAFNGNGRELGGVSSSGREDKYRNSMDIQSDAYSEYMRLSKSYLKDIGFELTKNQEKYLSGSLHDLVVQGKSADVDDLMLLAERAGTIPSTMPVGNILRWDQSKNQIVTAASKVGIDAGIVAMIANFESGFDPNARPVSRNPLLNSVQQFDGVMAMSTAHGYGQFLDGTWHNLLKSSGETYGLLGANRLTFAEAADLRTNTILQAGMLSEFTRQNISLGHKYGGLDDAANVYALHNLGGGDGSRFLKALQADPNTSVSEVLGGAVIRGNSSLYGDGSISLQSAYGKMGDAMRIGQFFADEARRMQQNLKR